MELDQKTLHALSYFHTVDVKDGSLPFLSSFYLMKWDSHLSVSREYTQCVPLRIYESVI